MVRGMQENRTHAGKHRVPHQFGNLFRHFAVRDMPPPDQHVGLVEQLFGDAAVFLIQRGGFDRDVLLFAEKSGNAAVNPLRVDGGNPLGAFFVAELIPYQNANHILFSFREKILFPLKKV